MGMFVIEFFKFDSVGCQLGNRFGWEKSFKQKQSCINIQWKGNGFNCQKHGLDRNWMQSSCKFTCVQWFRQSETL